MPPLDRAVEIYKKDGFWRLLSRSATFLISKFEGGLSSRRRVESISIAFRPIFNNLYYLKHGNQSDVMSEDWDTLILLDACRYDDFERQHDLPGTLESRISKGADSPEYIKENFAGRELHDTVYVTANPHVQMLDENVFHAIIDKPLSNWDPKTKCVRPEEVTTAAIRAHEDYSNKRIIVHYMQPHDPPLGSTGDEIREQFNLGGVHTTNQSEEPRLFEAVANGELDVEKARSAYRETLDIVLDEVNKLLAEINGRIVVSADHGEMFGEQPYPIIGKLYEHYRHPHTVELCKVPWLVIDQGSRRHTVSEPPTDTQSTSEEDLKEKLEALGYK
ncbi:hypothetical protein [Halorubrum halodurans]|uniref:hypothetical protein n=1 Tax=Halorubrum halodurans TaxID=1383851 RepID=UPI00117AC7D7|nr:hypothetical protein [Halorubrum halodurans]